MTIAETILFKISRNWPDYMKEQRMSLGNDFESDEYQVNYAIKQQLDRKVRQGVGIDIREKEILEIGCGHGGISIFLALNGAKRVVGIDLNTLHLSYARKVQEKIETKLSLSKPLPVEFLEINAYQMNFPNESFDLVMADNVFEHFMEPHKVMEQSHSALKKGGLLVVPYFSSIYCKYGLHLKNGLKVPWANLFFSEKTIVNVMKKICETNPKLTSVYPGVLENPIRVRDLRKYKDLNDITYSQFRKMARDTGFEISSFRPLSAPFFVGKAVSKLPIFRDTLVVDIFSAGANAILKKL